MVDNDAVKGMRQDSFELVIFENVDLNLSRWDFETYMDVSISLCLRMYAFT